VILVVGLAAINMCDCVRRREKNHKSWDLAAQRKDGTSDDLDRSVSFGSISTTNVKKLLTDFKTKSY
jgi:hypothetical protein